MGVAVVAQREDLDSGIAEPLGHLERVFGELERSLVLEVERRHERRGKPCHEPRLERPVDVRHHRGRTLE